MNITVKFSKDIRLESIHRAIEQAVAIWNRGESGNHLTLTDDTTGIRVDIKSEPVRILTS